MAKNRNSADERVWQITRDLKIASYFKMIEELLQLEITDRQGAFFKTLLSCFRELHKMKNRKHFHSETFDKLVCDVIATLEGRETYTNAVRLEKEKGNTVIIEERRPFDRVMKAIKFIYRPKKDQRNANVTYHFLVSLAEITAETYEQKVDLVNYKENMKSIYRTQVC